jgi:hypothetical protein
MDVAFLSEFSSIDEKSMNKEKTGIKQTPWITCLVGFAVGSVVTTNIYNVHFCIHMPRM